MAAPPPVPSSPTGDNPGSKGYIMFDLNLGLIVFSTLLISLRLYTRAAILKVVGLDDYVAVVAWAFCCALSSMEIYRTSRCSSFRLRAGQVLTRGSQLSAMGWAGTCKMSTQPSSSTSSM